MLATLAAVTMMALDPTYIACAVDGRPDEPAVPMTIDARNQRAILLESDSGKAYNRKARVIGSFVSILDDDTYWSIDARTGRYYRVTGKRREAVSDTGWCRLLDRRPANM